MNYKDIEKIIDSLCEKYSVDQNIFVVGYSSSHYNNRIRYPFQDRKRFNKIIAKYTILYYRPDDIYIVWNINYGVYSVLYEEIQNALTLGYEYINKFIDFRGKDLEKVLCFKSDKLEEFIKKQA